MPYREELYRIANHIASAKGALRDEWPSWADEIESDLRELASRERDKQKPVAIVDIQSGRSDGNKLAIVFTRAAHALPDDVYNLYAAPPAPDADVYAELYRLRAEVKGPDGFDTWRDAAIAERKARVECDKRVNPIDYLTAMGAFHSEQWHKMDPITGYMHGWNARLSTPPAPVVPECFARLHEAIKERHHGRMPEEVQKAFDECAAMIKEYK